MNPIFLKIERMRSELGVETDVTATRFSYCTSGIIKYYLVFFISVIFTVGNVKAETLSLEKLKEKYFLLGLVGYNYTDHHISDYTVNGAGGAFVRLSSATGGGSGITCCVKLSKKSIIPARVKVRWQYDGCIYLIRDDRTGDADKVRHFYYKEAEVDVLRADSGIPGYIETHFYPDGTVQVRTTDNFSDPSVILDPKRPDKSYFPRCKDDEKPEN